MKRLISGLMAVAVLLLSMGTVVFAADDEIVPKFGSITGVVQTVTNNDDSIVVSLESEDKGEAEVVLSYSTYIILPESGNSTIRDLEIEKGANVTAFFDQTLPMTMQYPPRYYAETAAIDIYDRTVMMDRFDENLVSSDNSLKLNIDESTEVISKDGSAFEGELAHKELIVMYSVSTRSIPAQTTPEKVIVNAYKMYGGEPTPNNDGEDMAYYTTVSGTITEIHPFYDENEEIVEGMSFISIVEENEQPATLFVDNNTFIASEKDLAVGDEVIGYYPTMGPMLMIYPPRYNVDVIVTKADDMVNVKADLFNDQLISSDNELMLNISDETEIVLQDGADYEDELSLENRKLVVYYDVTTRSIPAQTTPTKVVVLYERIMPLPIEVAPSPVVIDGVSLDVVTYKNADGMTMVPVRAVAEALGYTVGWDAETNSVTINEYISMFSIGNDYYTYMRVAPISLGAAPELYEGTTTYVPAHYFGEVLGYDISVENGTVFIDRSSIEWNQIAE